MAKQGRSHHLSPVKGGGVGGGFLKDHMVFRVRFDLGKLFVKSH